MYILNGIEIYGPHEENEITNKLRKSMWHPVFAKLTLLDHEKPEIPNWHKFLNGYHPMPILLSPYPWNNVEDHKNLLKIGNEYIVSIINQYHFHYMMPCILAVHFDCKSKKWWRPINHDCIPLYKGEFYHDENGQTLFVS